MMRIKFKLLMHSFKAQNNISPTYLSEFIKPHKSAGGLVLSHDQHHLVTNVMHTNHYGEWHSKMQHICFGFGYPSVFVKVILLKGKDSPVKSDILVNKQIR